MLQDRLAPDSRLQEMASASDGNGGAPDPRWRVSYAADLHLVRMISFNDGSLTPRRDALRLVLTDSRGVTTDVCFLRQGEEIDIDDVVSFPCHFTKVRDRLPAATTALAYVQGDTRRDAAVHGRRAGLHATEPSRTWTHPNPTNNPSMADARHVGSIHPTPRGDSTGINSLPTRSLT